MQSISLVKAASRATCGLLALMLAYPVHAQEWKPARNIEIVVSSDAGGAADRQGRAMQRMLQALPGMPGIVVTNRPGGAGTVAWSFVGQQAGDAHYISTLNTAIVTNQILGLTQLRYQDLTPLAILMRDAPAETIEVPLVRRERIRVQRRGHHPNLFVFVDLGDLHFDRVHVERRLIEHAPAALNEGEEIVPRCEALV